MHLGHDLSTPVFYYSLLHNVWDFNAAEIFSPGAKGMGGGGVELYGPLLL
jgi:hypothetical protein